jgi:hypothetical protein
MKRFMGSVIVAAALLAAPVTAHAGFTMGFRVGLGFPGGELVNGYDLSRNVAMSVPLMLQLGGAFAQDRVSVEGFFELSPMALSSDVTDTCSDCSAVGLRIGALGSFRFTPQKRFTPWVGLGIAYETLTEDTGFNSWTYSGLNWDFSGGVDFKLGRVFALGPFVSLQFGEFDSVSGDISGDLNTGMHSWFQIGARGRFDF